VVQPRLRLVVVLLAVASALAGCGGGGGNSDHETRTVLVDYAHDEMQTSMIDFFPHIVTVHPGDTVRFRQFWTGEAHNVTFGTVFNDALGRIRHRLDATPRPTAADVEADLAVVSPLPSILGTGGAFVVNQNGAQPCYLAKGVPPSDPQQACPRRAQPAFTGRESYYSSGFIPHEGDGANQFDLPLAADIDPGEYHYYCTLHGVGQSGTVVVAPTARAIPAQSAVSHAARAAIERDFAEPLRQATAQAASGTVTVAGTAYKTPLAGVAADGIRSWTGVTHQRHLEHRHGSVNQFVPTTVHTGVGQAVTWTFMGRHTVSFNVPKFFPIFSVAESGRVDINPNAHRPVGFPGRAPDLPATQKASVDAGTWDGEGFRSSGLDWLAGDRFSLAFSRPGTYLLACLVHPGMVGKVVVES
jgi:plastocyanin